MTEILIPTLPCRDIDDVAPFYGALGFVVTYRQERPYPYLCLERGGLNLHFFTLPTFVPEDSYSTVIMVVTDPGVIYDEFAAGLRAAFGRLPTAGIPRITRPRRKQGTAAGFSVVDPGGNWLRVTSRQSEREEQPAGLAGRLDRVLLNATRQGDSRGDERRAISLLEAGLVRHPDATDPERLPLLVYLAELLVRAGDHERALATLADIDAFDLADSADPAVVAELATADEIKQGLAGGGTVRT